MKQNTQMSCLRAALERTGWIVAKEHAVSFEGIPQCEHGDSIPCVVFSWDIRKNDPADDIVLDFVDGLDGVHEDRLENTCAEVQVRDTDIRLWFFEWDSLVTREAERAREEDLAAFMARIDGLHWTSDSRGRRT